MFAVEVSNLFPGTPATAKSRPAPVEVNDVDTASTSAQAATFEEELLALLVPPPAVPPNIEVPIAEIVEPPPVGEDVLASEDNSLPQSALPGFVATTPTLPAANSLPLDDGAAPAPSSVEVDGVPQTVETHLTLDDIVVTNKPMEKTATAALENTTLPPETNQPQPHELLPEVSPQPEKLTSLTENSQPPVAPAPVSEDTLPEQASADPLVVTTTGETFADETSGETPDHEHAKQQSVAEAIEPVSAEATDAEPEIVDNPPNPASSFSDSTLSTGAMPHVASAAEVSVARTQTSAEPLGLAQQIANEAVRQADVVKNGGQQTFIMRLDPPELGKLTVQMKKTAKGISLKVNAVDPATLGMIQSSVEELTSNLSQQDSIFQEIDIDVQTESESQHSSREEPSSKNRQPKLVDAAPVLPESTSDLSFVA